MNRLLHVYIRPFLGRMSVGLAVKFVGTIMDLFLPWILAVAAMFLLGVELTA